MDMRPGATFSHSWSLCIEEQFYLILPIAVILISYTKKSIGLGWLVLSAAIGLAIVVRGMVWFNYGQNAITGSDFFQHIYYSSFTRFDELLFGVALSMFKNFHTQSYEKVLRYGNVLLVAGIASVGITLYLMSQFLATDESGNNFWLTTFGYSLLALSFALLTLSAVSPNSLLNRIRIPGAASIALWSYAIYLTHKPIFKLAVEPLNQLNINTDSYLGIAIVIAVSVLGGWILYRLVETPFMRLRDKFYSFDNVKSNAGFEKAKGLQYPG
jgi:peptidoglycan/LPS O-acetylase OafA/YrhL